jgi:hypothetical protein
LFARGREEKGDEAVRRLIDSDGTDQTFIQVKEDIMTSIKLEREQTKRLTIGVLFTGDGSPTKNVRRIWLAFPISFSFLLFSVKLLTTFVNSGSVY